MQGRALTNSDQAFNAAANLRKSVYWQGVLLAALVHMRWHQADPRRGIRSPKTICQRARSPRRVPRRSWLNLQLDEKFCYNF